MRRNKTTRLVLKLDALDYKVVQDEITDFKNGPCGGILPDGHSNEVGAIIAESIRGLREYRQLADMRMGVPAEQIPLPPRYSHSRDGERYHGDFSTPEEAAREALAGCSVGSWVWVGEAVPPTPPENCWDASDWLEHVSCQDDYDNDFGIDWDTSTPQLRAELEAEVRQVMAAWLDRHGLRPMHFTIINPVEYVVAGNGVAEIRGREP